jgi:hypothetical protein
MSQVCFSLSVCSHSFLWIPCIRARPPLSPSFHPHSWFSDFRSVHGGCSQFSRCCYLIIDLGSRLSMEAGPGVGRSHPFSFEECSRERVCCACASPHARTSAGHPIPSAFPGNARALLMNSKNDCPTASKKQTKAAPATSNAENRDSKLLLTLAQRTPPKPLVHGAPSLTISYC